MYDREEWERQFREGARQLQAEFRARVLGQFGRDLNAEEETQLRTVDISIAMGHFLNEEMEAGTSLSAIVAAFGAAFLSAMETISQRYQVPDTQVFAMIEGFMNHYLVSRANGEAATMTVPPENTSIN